MTDPRSRLPGLTSLLAAPEIAAAVDEHGRERVVEALRAAVAEARHRVAAGAPVPDEPRLVADALDRVAGEDQQALGEVVNATGVLLHTNLGRAPLSAEAVAAAAGAARTTNLELDLATGERGGREARARRALARLAGAEDALVVNNGAAALVLALAVVASGREVAVSRGELIEIGGSFRLPEVMGSAGVALREVGTTNRTHLDDYRRALDAGVAAVLRAHPSNFSMDGFVARPEREALAGLTRAAGVPLIHDVGSGLLRPHPAAPDEPTVAGAVADGADLVAFSGDKLLGGPQAGVLTGDAALVTRARRHPLARALRLDKLRLAALEATLAAYERGDESGLPLWAMAAAPVEDLVARARRLAAACDGEVVETRAVLGGGAAPDAGLPSVGVALPGPPEALTAALRRGRPPVVGRIVDDRAVLDLRSVPEHLDEALLRVAREACGAG